MATETRETTLQMHNGTGGAGPFTFTFTAHEADDIFVGVLNENEASSDYGKYEPKTVDTHYELDLPNKRITFKADNTIFFLFMFWFLFWLRCGCWFCCTKTIHFNYAVILV